MSENEAIPVSYPQLDTEVLKRRRQQRVHA